MNYDNQKVDDAVLALLSMTLHDGNRAWKGFDWAVLERLHQSGMISNPVNASKSVVLTDQGLKRADELCQTLFAENAS
jgi:hypothetical protein